MNIRKKFLNEKGFTLIEMIASLVILAIVGALVIISTIKIVQGFVFTKMNAETSQKGHIALNRLTKEFTNIMSVDTETTTATRIDFTSRNYITCLPIEPPYTPQSVSWGSSGDPLLLSGVTLVDNVSDFSLRYYDGYDDSSGAETWSTTTSKAIGITLSLFGANNTEPTFITRVVPRNQ